MLIVSYDISDDRIRNKFSKFLKKYGFRLQFSVFEIRNSDRVLRNVITEIQNNYVKYFTESDSVVIFSLSETCKKYCFGFAAHNDDDIVIVGA